MELIQLTERQFTPGSKVAKKWSNLQSLWNAVSKREISKEALEAINQDISAFNAMEGSEAQMRKKIFKLQQAILSRLLKFDKIVPEHYYQNLWMGIGLASFGVPIGIAIGSALDNMGFMGVGIGMGLPLGLAVGAGMDKKAAKEGRQIIF